MRWAAIVLVACSSTPQVSSPPTPTSPIDADPVAPPIAAKQPPVEIVAGAFHTCARTVDGHVYCWGDNRMGQLGDGTRERRATPTRVVDLTNAVELSAGEQHTCARLADGGVRCWGKQPEAEDAPATKPVRVEIDQVIAISSGADHHCAVRRDDTAWCWGANAGGQASDTDPARVIVKPVQVGTLADVVEVRAGVRQSCARTKAGAVSCWGDRDAMRGQARKPLGAVDGVNAAQVAVGLYGACARVENRVRCWPGKDRADITALGDVAQLVGNEDRYCAITAKREVSCWSGSYGWIQMRRVSRMPSFDGAEQLAVGRFHTCALRAGSITCGGENEHGQLGNGKRGFVLVPVRVASLSGATHVELDGQAPCAAVGGEVKCVRSDPPKKLRGVVEVGEACALLASGAVTCWGDNSVAQLGRAQPAFSLEALAVPGIAGATSLSTSGARRCAVAKGRVRCWGNDNSVSIHDLSARPKRVEIRATEIPNIRDAVGVSLGFSLGCALLKDKTVTCWKTRDYDAGTVARYADSKPEVVAGIANATQISVGRDTAAAVLEDGSIIMWGRDFEIGLAPLPPTRVDAVNDAVEVRLGKHACMRHRDGRVSCWGKIGRLPEFILESKTPVPMAGVTNAVGIAVGGENSCARLAGGDVVCWGMNHEGELGVPLGEEVPPAAVKW